MAMDLRNPDVWLAHLLENLPEDKLSAALDDGNADWEFVDSEIVKLGSLAHSQLDIPELQRRGLMLLASETKDFRLLAVPCNMPVIFCWPPGCWHNIQSTTGHAPHRRTWPTKNALPPR